MSLGSAGLWTGWIPFDYLPVPQKGPFTKCSRVRRNSKPSEKQFQSRTDPAAHSPKCVLDTSGGGVEHRLNDLK